MRRLVLAMLFATAACSDDGGTSDPVEVITTVSLTFTPMAGGPAQTFSFKDPDGDGGTAPTIDPVNVVAGPFTVGVKFLNELESPAEDITVEVMDEGDVHQVFFTGTGVNGPATANTTGPFTHAYADTDAGGAPVGLANTITAATGTGTMIVTLRHMPPINDMPVKTATLADTVKTSGIAGLPGDTDVSVTFNVTVP